MDELMTIIYNGKSFYDGAYKIREVKILLK